MAILPQFVLKIRKTSLDHSTGQKNRMQRCKYPDEKLDGYFRCKSDTAQRNSMVMTNSDTVAA